MSFLLPLCAVGGVGTLHSSYLAPAASGEAEYEAEAPLDSYAPEEEEEYAEYGSAEQDLGGYEEEEIGGYEEDSALDAAASEASGEAADPLKMLMNAVPGVPGEDYPIYAETPETAFSCDGQVDGGKKIFFFRYFINIYTLQYQVTTLMKRPSAKYSTSAPLTAPAAWPSTASSAPTEPFSTRTTSSATGGSTWTVLNPLL